MATKVNDKSEAVAKHEKVWAMIAALMGGTEAMRKAGPTYLPKWPAEEEDRYAFRLSVSTLYPALRRTLSVMIGKPFSEPLVLGDDVPEPIKEWCEDIDLEGNSLHTWAATAFWEPMGYGLAGVLVDMPVVNGGSGARTKKDEKDLGVRPYFVLIRHSALLGWKVGKDNKGKPMLTQLRLMECVQEDDGSFGTVDISQIRVLEPGKWFTYREKENANKVKEWVLHEEGIFTLNKVPFIPFYGERLGFMDAEPPLKDLAYLNTKHWQSQSDQDNITHTARVPILAAIGAGEETQLQVGGSIVKIPNPQGDLKYVEHTGAAIKAGADAIEKLELQMVQTGAELLIMKPGTRTATESNNEADGNKSDLQRIVEGFEDSLDQALDLMAEWMKTTEGGGHIKLFTDFGAWSLDAASGVLIKDLAMAGMITKETALRELQRRGTLSADIDPKEELEAVDEQGPALGSMGDPGALPPSGGGAAQ